MQASTGEQIRAYNALIRDLSTETPRVIPHDEATICLEKANRLKASIADEANKLATAGHSADVFALLALLHKLDLVISELGGERESARALSPRLTADGDGEIAFLERLLTWFGSDQLICPNPTEFEAPEGNGKPGQNLRLQIEFPEIFDHEETSEALGRLIHTLSMLHIMQGGSGLEISDFELHVTAGTGAPSHV